MKYSRGEKTMKKILGILVALLVLTMAVSALAVDFSATAYSKYGWVITPGSSNEAHQVTAGIMLPGDTEETVYTSIVLDNYNEQSYVYECEAIAEQLETGTFVEILFNAQDEVIGFVRIERPIAGRTEYYHDSMLFGGELTAVGGGAGNMVASGWIMDTAEGTITLGDGNHVVNSFEETYVLADDVKIFLVDNNGVDAEGNAIEGTFVCTPATAADIIVTPKNADGEIYGVGTTRAALAIFNESAVDPATGKTRTDDCSTVRVTELYINKNLTKLSSTCTPDNVGYNGTSWFPGNDKNEGKTSAGWNGTITPFEVMKDRMYSLGDGYTCIYLYVSDPDENGNVVLSELDAGNATATYSYWLNMWKMGYDPRDVDNLFLTHGHGDHYQGAVELATMIERNGNKLQVRTSGANQEGYVNGVYAGITLTAKAERYLITYFNDWNTWIDCGEGVSIYPVTTAGHTNDTASYVFMLNSKLDDPYFSKVTDKESKVAWVYMGGYGGGAATKASNGYTRLQYANSMRYMQSVVIPYAESVSDFVYSLPQHGDQAPWSEVAKATRMKGIMFLDAYNEGTEGIINLMEKRMSAYTYNWMNKAWKATESTKGETPVDLYDQIIVPVIREAGYNWFCTPQNTKTEALEVSGPWKREAGEYEIEVKGILVMHGFDAFQNKNEALAGIENIYGWDLSNGMSVDRDSYSHDPNGWYVQLVVDVNDDYVGGVYFTAEAAADMAAKDGRAEAYPINWYVAGGNTYVDFDGNPVTPSSGPVESFLGADWVEIVRTQRLNTKEEAENLAAYLQQNIDAGNSKFVVKMDLAGDIVLPEGYISAANCSVDDPVLNALDDDTIKVTFPGTGYYSLEEEAAVIARCCELNNDNGIDLSTMFVISE